MEDILGKFLAVLKCAGNLPRCQNCSLTCYTLGAWAVPTLEHKAEFIFKITWIANIYLSHREFSEYLTEWLKSFFQMAVFLLVSASIYPIFLAINFLLVEHALFLSCITVVYLSLVPPLLKSYSAEKTVSVCCLHNRSWGIHWDVLCMYSFCYRKW